METSGARTRPVTVRGCSCGPDYVATLPETLSTSTEIRSVRGMLTPTAIFWWSQPRGPDGSSRFDCRPSTVASELQGDEAIDVQANLILTQRPRRTLKIRGRRCC